MPRPPSPSTSENEPFSRFVCDGLPGGLPPHLLQVWLRFGLARMITVMATSAASRYRGYITPTRTLKSAIARVSAAPEAYIAKASHGSSSGLRQPCWKVGRYAVKSVATDSATAAARGTNAGQRAEAASRATPAPPRTRHPASRWPKSRSPWRQPNTTIAAHPTAHAPV